MMTKSILACALFACGAAERDTWVWPDEEPKLGCVSLDDDVFDPECNGNFGARTSNPCKSARSAYCISGKCNNRCGCDEGQGCAYPCNDAKVSLDCACLRSISHTGHRSIRNAKVTFMGRVGGGVANHLSIPRCPSTGPSASRAHGVLNRMTKTSPTFGMSTTTADPSC